jgi:hypothetical protein
MPIDASPSGTLDIENATLRSREIVALTSMVTGNDVIRSSNPPALEVYGDPSHGGNEARLELVSNTATESSKAFTQLTSNAGVFSVKSGTDASDNGTITFGGFANERLRITSDGKVGVGTDDPETNLHVKGNIIGRPISKTRTITKGTSLYGEVGTFTLADDENRILLNNNQGSVASSRDYTANFTTGVPTAIGTIIHLEINSSRTNNSASAVNHRTRIQFNSVDVLSTGNQYLPPSVPAYQRNLKRTIILTTDGWVDYSVYPCVSKSVTDSAVIVSATNNSRKASVGVDNPLTEVMRVQINPFNDPQVGINCVPDYDQTLDVNGRIRSRTGFITGSINVTAPANGVRVNVIDLDTTLFAEATVLWNAYDIGTHFQTGGRSYTTFNGGIFVVTYRVDYESGMFFDLDGSTLRVRQNYGTDRPVTCNYTILNKK